MSQKREQIDDIFLRALQCSSAHQRATYLETACGGDSQLSKRIEQLVQAYPEAKEFLETPAATGITALDELFHECLGSQIGPYKLVREIGRGQFIGTPEYTSPEQASLNPLDVDTRSDIYSSGVLLYELICGSTPPERERLRTVAFDEMLRRIRQEEPPRPSKRLSASNTLGLIAEVRQTNAVKLYKLVREELGWIVMKTLEKERSRRYESASNLAADIERYLNGDPVLACPPSMGYRFQKFARRGNVWSFCGTQGGASRRSVAPLCPGRRFAVAPRRSAPGCPGLPLCKPVGL